jgi:hypothetical protein
MASSISRSGIQLISYAKTEAKDSIEVVAQCSRYGSNLEGGERGDRHVYQRIKQEVDQQRIGVNTVTLGSRLLDPYERLNLNA